MILEFTLTKEDLAESTAPVVPPGQRRKKRAGMIGWVLFGGLAAVLVLLLNLEHTATPAPSPQIPPPVATNPYAQQNLWTTLAPPLFPVSLVLMAMLAAKINTKKRENKTKQPAGSADAAPGSAPSGCGLPVVLILLPLVLLGFVTLMPGFAIPWNPSPMLAAVVSFSPWIVMVFVLSLVNRITRRNAATKAWEKAIWLHRPTRLDVTGEAVLIDNGLMQCKRQWSCFTRYRETENLILLTTEEQAMVIIPKRSAVEAGCLDALYGTIQTSISTGEFLPRESRFPVLPAPVMGVIPDGQPQSLPSSTPTAAMEPPATTAVETSSSK